MMRIKYAIKNMAINMLSQVVILLLAFVSRKVFIDSLGTEYLGINGLLTNVISMLSLAESGIGLSIVYNLYKPLAEDDREKIIALIQLYKKAYGVLAVIILILSLAIYPFMNNLMKGAENIKFISLVYFIFVARNVISYLNAHKWSLINADQKGYVLAKFNLMFQVITILGKIIILVLTKNYVLYLTLELGLFVFQNIFNGKIVDKRYSYIKTKKKYSIDLNTKKNIIKNVKAMFLHSIGGFCVNGTDNILISSFISIKAVGLYSNYSMVIGQLAALLGPVLSGISVGVGNLIATESEEKRYEVFKVSYFITFWMYSFCVIFLYNLLEPFINLWIGEGFLLDKRTFLIILLNFYLVGLRSVVLSFKMKSGLFTQDKYVPLIEGGVNLIASLILIPYLGLSGVFLGTTISTLSIVFWNQPRIVYKYVFKKPVIAYFIKYASYIVIMMVTGAITTFMCKFLVNGYSFISLCVKGTLCVGIVNGIYLAMFYRTDEFKYLLGVLKSQAPGKYRHKRLSGVI
ncbi:MAG: oligosaccharide flippase family protein [Clostridium sp.]|uniref:lipopolysaccharide biosynthesis protein n=2 Tax=Clostridium sp. TaxID=1506 RepID=UPI003216E9B7